MNETVIKHLPFEDGDIVRVFGNETYSDEGDREIFETKLPCESCQEAGSFYLEAESRMSKIGLCWTHLLCTYDSIKIEEQKRNWVMFWQRAMNSGTTVFKNETLDLVKKVSYQPEHVKTIIVQGNIVDMFGEKD